MDLDPLTRDRDVQVPPVWWQLAIATLAVMLAVMMGTASIIGHISRVEEKLDTLMIRTDALARAQGAAAPATPSAAQPTAPGQIASPQRSVY